MNIVVFNGSPRKKSNSSNLLSSFCDLCESKGHSVYSIQSLNPCVHCSQCHDKGKCSLKDMTKEVHQSLLNADAIVISTPVHFFSLTPKSLGFITRLYSISLSNKIFGLIVSSGSDFEDSGVSVIQDQFKNIDRYCGSITVPFFHRVTYDKVWDTSDRDNEGLSVLLSNIEDAYNEVTK